MNSAEQCRRVPHPHLTCRRKEDLFTKGPADGGGRSSTETAQGKGMAHGWHWSNPKSKFVFFAGFRSFRVRKSFGHP